MSTHNRIAARRAIHVDISERLDIEPKEFLDQYLDAHSRYGDDILFKTGEECGYLSRTR